LRGTESRLGAGRRFTLIFCLANTGRRLPRAVLAFILVAPILVIQSVAVAARDSPSYPKVAVYTNKVGAMGAAELDTLSWYDAIVMPEGPGVVRELRERNPEIRLYFDWMPQNIVHWGEDETAWFPDTTWSLIRLAEFYALKNDWYLRDTQNERIQEWDGWAANWTRYCPKGTYGTSRGLNYVEWLVRVAIPQVTNGGESWARWGRGSSAYDGIMFEILVDCVGSWGYRPYENADPDQDGQAEGVHGACSVGGDQDSLTILYREMNDAFRPAVERLRSEGVTLLLNAGNSHMGPSWRGDFDGIKLEGYLTASQQPWDTWWTAFYCARSPNGADLWGPGYYWAEQNVGLSQPDSLGGWDATIVQALLRPGTSESDASRIKRLCLGTTLLGNGYFTYSRDQHSPSWQPEYDRDLGRPLAPLTKEVFVPSDPSYRSDTLYVRVFSKGLVEVNPQAHPVRGVPAQDARLGYWSRVDDLTVLEASPRSVVLRFTPPRDVSLGPTPSDTFELRYFSEPLTLNNWNSATPFAGNPVHGQPGRAVQVGVEGLEPARTYHFALLNTVYDRAAPFLSNVALATTPTFLPGDSNGDGRVNIQDAVYTLAYLEWDGPVPPCLAAADVDSSGVVDSLDVIRFLRLRFGPMGARPKAAVVVDGWRAEDVDTIGCACIRLTDPGCPDPGTPVTGRIEVEASAGDSLRLLPRLTPNGDSVEVACLVRSPRDLLGFEFAFRYDPSAFSYAGFEAGRASGAAFLSALSAADTIRLGCLSDLRLRRTFASGELEIGTIRFALRDAARDEVGSLSVTGTRLMAPDLSSLRVADRILRLPDPSDSAGVTEPPLTLSLRNPYRFGSPVLLRARSPGEVRLVLYNVLGQQVRVVFARTIGIGQREVRWDGRTDAGARVSGGIYYLVIEFGGYRQVQKLLIIQ
jgi:hypothetical protein